MKQEYTYIYDGMTAFEKEVKRWCDFLTALVCIILFSPLFLLCYIAIKRDNDGPVIYKQIRIGRFGRPFYIYKFRSMVVDAEKEGKPQLWNAKTDRRLTKTGKFLRDHHLDELPQFWNVLVGDMSVSSTSDKSWSMILATSASIRFDQVLRRWQPSITVIPTRWRKC